MRRWQYLLPLALFAVLTVFLGTGLKLDPREVPSPLIDKPAPAFVLPSLHEPDKQLSLQDMAGKVWVLNVWASWCTPCLAEHPLFVDLAKRRNVNLVGLNYKDKRENALNWLRRHGNPYSASMADNKGLVAIDYGVYGVPETFVIDKQGQIRFKHVGPVTAEVLRQDIEPLLKALDA